MSAPKRTMYRASVLLLLCVAAAPVPAQWTGKAELGMALSSGNTDTKSGNAKLAATWKEGAWETTGRAAGLYVQDDGMTTGQRFEVGVDTRRNFGSHTYWYGGARYEDDRFSGFEYQALVSTGVGRKFIDRDDTHLSAQIGVGYKTFETTGVPPLLDDKNSSIAGAAGVNYDHQFNASTGIYDRFTAETTSSNNFLQNEIGLQVKMTGRLLLALAYSVRHNTDPPTGFKKTDTLTTVNLAYEVK